MAKSNVLPDVPSPQRDFKQREQQNSKTAIGLDGKTTTLQVDHAFCTFLCRHCLISPIMEDVNPRQQLCFSRFPELRYTHLEFNPRIIARI